MNILTIFQDIMELIASNYISVGIFIVIIVAIIMKLLFVADDSDGFIKVLLYLLIFILLGVMVDLVICIITP